MNNIYKKINSQNKNKITMMHTKTKLLLLAILLVPAFMLGQDDEKKLINMMLNEGYNYYEQGKIKESEQIYDNILEVDSLCYRAYNGKASIYEYYKKFDSALLFINKAIAINNNYDGGYVTKGNIYLESGNLKQAYKNYEKALNINNINTNAINGIATVYFYEGKSSKAKSKYNTRSVVDI